MQKEEYQILIKDIKALLQNICKDDRVKYHIEPVVKSAKNLALKFNADVQVVEIASYLHDVTKITGDRKKHHITGAKYAEDFLSKYNIEEWKVESIKNCIKKHRGLSEYTRDTIEEKMSQLQMLLHTLNIHLHFFMHGMEKDNVKLMKVLTEL